VINGISYEEAKKNKGLKQFFADEEDEETDT